MLVILPHKENWNYYKVKDFTPLKWESLNDVLAQCNTRIMEPDNYEEADQYDSWKKAMQAEIDMIKKNHTWDLVK